MNDGETVPNAALNPRRPAPRQPTPSVPHPSGRPLPPRPKKRGRGKITARVWLWLGVGTISFLLVTMLSVVILWLTLTYDRGVLPGVTVGAVTLGGLSEDQAAARLQAEWQTATLRDQDRVWDVNPEALGINLDAAETAQRAYARGRGSGNVLAALFGTVNVVPVVRVDAAVARDELARLRDRLELAPVDAGVAFENGQVVATPPENGRALDIDATLLRWQSDRAIITGGDLPLIMRDVAPAVTDASPLLAQARAVLNNPLDIRIFDPVTGDSVYWSLLPAEWGQWLTAQPDPASPIGLTLSADPEQVRAYVEAQAGTLGATRTVNAEAAVQAIRSALANGRPGDAVITVEHLPRTHTVRAGETITSIAWDYGIPYLYIVQANGGQEFVSAGQQINLPPADAFLLFDPVPDKRIEISLSQQRTRVYENGQLKWDWISSTGIPDSPTWPGVYQVISHVPNAYAGNWNLYMPNFIGVYQPVPGADFTNGFHGFPTRGGGRLLWTSDLGRRVTYGCILLGDAEAQMLYNWAEKGVVVEILP